MFMNWKSQYSKMATLPKLVHRFNPIPDKDKQIVYAETDRPILKFTWKYKGSVIAKITLKKNNKFRRWYLRHTMKPKYGQY